MDVARLLPDLLHCRETRADQYIAAVRPADRNKNRSQKLLQISCLPVLLAFRFVTYNTRRPTTLGFKETLLSKIARRKFIQLSAVAAAGYFIQPGREVQAGDLPQLSVDDPMAQAMKYTHDASTVDPATRNNPAAEQNCANCALVQGSDGEEWRPCQIFPGKAVAAAGWCSVWAPKA